MKSLSKVTIPRRITDGEDLIVVRRQEYEKLLKHLEEIKVALIVMK